jgi:hypothetical protein
MSRRPYGLLLAVLPVMAGCGHIYHRPCDDGPPWRPADTVPDEMKACVYVFLIDAYDPFAVGQLAELRDHLHRLGFGKTYYGWPHHLGHFEVELGTVHADRPNARFVVIGHGTGACAARDLVVFADTLGIPIDTVIYLEPVGLDVMAAPNAAMSTFTVRAADLGATDGTMVGRYLHKSEVATHPEVIELVERELTLIGLSVPPPPRLPGPRVFLVEPMPPPRDVIPIPEELPREWQFLRPRHPWLPPLPPSPHGDETLPYPQRTPELPPPKPAG